MNIRLAGELLTRSILGIRSGSCESQNLTAPSIPVTVDHGKLDPYDLVGTIDFNFHHPSTLVWSLCDPNGDLVHRSTDYELSEDGRTATFKHIVPALGGGDTYTITQDVIISNS